VSRPDRGLGPPPSSPPSQTEAHPKRRAGFGDESPACGYGIEAGAGEVGVDVLESGFGRSAQSSGIGKDRADQDRV
jgi:hypothetical protein